MGETITVLGPEVADVARAADRNNIQAIFKFINCITETNNT